MSNRNFFTGSTIAIAVIFVFLKGAVVIQAAEANDQMMHQAVKEVEELTLVSLSLVDEAIATLSLGWQTMSQEQKETFLRMYDPSDTGEVDAKYAAKVLDNYQMIRSQLASDVKAVYSAQSDRCEGKRLYYTDMLRLYVCPYFFEEENELRKARTLIHEMAHIGLKVTDRPYYRSTSKQYAKLTPNGSWLVKVPIAGRVLRELLRGDTLYHPDAYAHFALLNAGYTNIYTVGDSSTNNS